MGFRHQLGSGIIEYTQLMIVILTVISAGTISLSETYSSIITERINALSAVMSV